MTDRFDRTRQALKDRAEAGDVTLLLDVAAFLMGNTLQAAIALAAKVPDAGLRRRLEKRLALEVQSTAANQPPLLTGHGKRASIVRFLAQLPEDERARLLSELLNALSRHGPPGPALLTDRFSRIQPTRFANRHILGNVPKFTVREMPEIKGRHLIDWRALKGIDWKTSLPGEPTRQPTRSTRQRAKGPQEPNGLPTSGGQAPRRVNCGFATRGRPGTSRSPGTPLRSGGTYYLWVEISGHHLTGSISEPDAPPLPALPDEAKLTVTVCGFDGEIQPTAGSDVGEILLVADGTTRVTRPAGSPPAASVRADLLTRRLFFPIQIPDREGPLRLRCNVYYAQVLVQSILVSTTAARKPTASSDGASASIAHVDYVLSHDLDPVRLRQTTPHRLSILLNSVDSGATHGFHFYGADGAGDFKRDDVRFQEAALQNFIDDARGTFNLASWGTTDAWQAGENPKQTYRYADGQRNLDRLRDDLVNFARWGWTFYSSLIDRLTGGVNQSDELARLMAKPGLIQIALKASASYILPVSLIYDYPLDTQLHSSLCDRFLAAINHGEDLQTLPCFSGACPNHGKLDVVCPSGFWGYRHEIGMPISLSPSPGVDDAVSVIEYQPPLNLSASVATDLALLAEHEQSLRSLVPGLACDIAQSRDAVLAQLKRGEADVVYFYCHGGVSRSVPFLQVGPADNPGIIDASNLRAYQIRWSPLRPLVFINGCHTTAVAPDQAINFVSAFLEYSNAAGVIGTEITIFEPLARQFAEDYLRRFFAGADLGAAIRGARLALLASGNPLGLVYLPFAMADLRLAAKG